MARGRSPKFDKPSLLYSLSQYQADWLRRARDTEGGVYVPITVGVEPGQLVAGGAAAYREVRKSSDADHAQGFTPCEWTDYYLVPTQYGLTLLGLARI